MVRKWLSVGILLMFLLSLVAVPVLAKPKPENPSKVQVELRGKGKDREAKMREEVEEREGDQVTVTETVYEGKEKKERKEERERKEKEERGKESVEKKVYGERKIEFAGVVTSVYGDTITVVKGGLGNQEEKTFTLTPETKIVLVGHLKKEYRDPAAALKAKVMVKVKADAEGNVKELRILPSRKGEALSVVAVIYGDREIGFDVPPFIEDGRTMVPVRAIAEALGLEVHYEKASGMVTITNKSNNRTVIFWIGQKQYQAGAQQGEMDVAAKIVADRTFIPLRYLGQALGQKVDWLGEGMVEIE
ncbi:copper amine oxidase N-terminal domain-containing protein [Desulfothermobacter acidiphilus]|uniref:copper amine oxidase N-terminal domain-containing protein n=1 Tax=Desulfothermobacter acidiphilus TaxID=1938353 RepID=UPI003F8CEDDA